jgi:hypothetical protein
MFGELGGLLSKKATFLFGIETTKGVNPGLDGNHAVEVSDPEYTTDLTILERDYVSNDLSPFEHQVGRIIAGFKAVVPVRGNGKQHSGLLADAPILARMIQACGYELYAMAATGVDCHSPVVANSDNNKASPAVSWASNVAATSNTAPVLYTIEVTTAGASGAARFTVTSNSPSNALLPGGDEIAAPVQTPVVTSGVTAVALGAKGGTVTPTWVGNLTVGQKWQVACFPRGIKARPVSENHKTASIELNGDGLYHEGNKAIGSFSLDATAGQTAKMTFNYTTTFVQPTDDVMPVADFGNLPLEPQVELATLTWGGNSDLMVEKFTIDAASQIEARPSVNHAKGYASSRIVDRAPKFGFNPEATKEADHPFWDEFVKARSKTFLTRIGTEVGNQVVFFIGKGQTSEQPYGDRSGTRTYEKSGGAKRIKGNDELIIVFC